MQRYAYLLRKELDLILILKKKKKMNWKDFNRNLMFLFLFFLSEGWWIWNLAILLKTIKSTSWITKFLKI